MSKLSKYFSPQVYNSIFSGELDVTINTKRKNLTVFFSDIKSFTTITEKLEPEILTDLITNYLRELSQEIHSYYNKHPILVEEEDLRNARLSLMEATKYVFENSGKIIGINMPDKM